MRVPRFLILTIIIIGLGYTTIAQSRKWTIPSGTTTAQFLETLREAKPYDTIFVENGTYYLTPLKIDKPLTLIGEDYPVLDFQNESKGFLISAHYVTIEGIHFANTAFSEMEDLAAIRVDASKNFSARNNRFSNTFFGIYLSNSSNCKIVGNVLEGKENKGKEFLAGNGIHAWQCKKIEIKDNTITHHRDGIYFEFVDSSYIAHNISEANIRYGLHFMFSHWDAYHYNVFRQNAAGVAVMYSNHVEMSENLFTENWGDANYGLLLKELNDGTIINNTFSYNTTAILIEGSNRMDVKNNLLENNGWAMKVSANSYENVFFENVFLGNSFDMATNGNTVMNDFSKNYWDRYKGYDLDHNGLGDIPFHPVSLFSMIVEKMPFSMMLYRSFLVDLLNQSERIMPAVIPQDLVDNEPLMNMPLAGKQSNKQITISLSEK